MEFTYTLLTVAEQKAEVENQLRNLERSRYQQTLNVSMAANDAERANFTAAVAAVDAKITVLRGELERLNGEG